MSAAIEAARSEAIARAARALARGELVIFPTETVYGLGARARDATAVRRVFAAKGRPAEHPLIVHLPDPGHLDAWARDVPPAARAVAEAFWPGPLTMVLARGPAVPDAVTGGQDSVALRVPAHPVARELLATLGDGIAAPSANRFGGISPTLAADAAAELGEVVAMVLDGGPCEIGVESTIVDLRGDPPRLLRPGGVSAERLAEALGRPLAGADAEGPRHSGGLPSHYAPGTPTRLVDGAALRRPDDGVVALLRRASVPPGTPAERLPADAEGYARGLYAALRRLDRRGAAAIWVEAPPPGSAWAAVRDRLRRASSRGGPGSGPPGP